MEKWPNLFIVGAPKAGTSSLYAYLKNIPGIYMSPYKEPNYFSAKTIGEKSVARPIRDKTKYLSLFKQVKDEKIIGEASPSYLSDPDAAKLIHRVNPDARIIISLRDPVERTFSYYLMFIRLGLMKDSFHDELQRSLKLVRVFNKRSLRLETGLYAEDIQRYLDIFGQEKVKIIIFEEFIKDTKSTMMEILSFFNVNYHLDDFKGESYNYFARGRGLVAQFLLREKRIRFFAEKFTSPNTRRVLREKLLLKKDIKPKMDKEERDILVKFYKNDVKETQKILGRKLQWKNFDKLI